TDTRTTSRLKKMELVNCEEVEGRRKKIKERGQWNSNIEFLLVVAGNIVGLENVWRCKLSVATPGTQV
uniref:Uncharacterized protein n=1 Tax=Denticeps clupeoides TaxID=299321 RepID=A0A8C3ZQ25_9TELE